MAIVSPSRGCAIDRVYQKPQPRHADERCMMHCMPSVYDAAYQGTRGANSEDAAIDLLSNEAQLFPRDTLEDVFAAVAQGEARYGVVPIENTLAGSIHRCYDLLFEHDAKIVGETVRRIVFALIAPPGEIGRASCRERV